MLKRLSKPRSPSVSQALSGLRTDFNQSVVHHQRSIRGAVVLQPQRARHHWFKARFQEKYNSWQGYDASHLLLAYACYQIAVSVIAYREDHKKYEERNKKAHHITHQHYHAMMAMNTFLFIWSNILTHKHNNHKLAVSASLAYSLAYMAYKNHRRAIEEAMITLDPTPLTQLFIEMWNKVPRQMDVLRADIVVSRQNFLAHQAMSLEAIKVAKENLERQPLHKEHQAHYKRVIYEAINEVEFYSEAFKDYLSEIETLDKHAAPPQREELAQVAQVVKKQLLHAKAFKEDVKKLLEHKKPVKQKNLFLKLYSNLAFFGKTKGHTEGSAAKVKFIKFS